MFHTGWGGEQITLYKGVEIFFQQKLFKALRGNPNRIISVSGGSGPLQMVSELDTGRCVSLLAVPQRG